jgi:hypothetical protein
VFGVIQGGDGTWLPLALVRFIAGYDTTERYTGADGSYSVTLDLQTDAAVKKSAAGYMNK